MCVILRGGGQMFPYKDSKIWSFKHWGPACGPHEGRDKKNSKCLSESVTMQTAFLLGVGLCDEKIYSFVRIKVIEVYGKASQFPETNVCKTKPAFGKTDIISRWRILLEAYHGI